VIIYPPVNAAVGNCINALGTISVRRDPSYWLLLSLTSGTNPRTWLVGQVDLRSSGRWERRVQIGELGSSWEYDLELVAADAALTDAWNLYMAEHRSKDSIQRPTSGMTLLASVHFRRQPQTGICSTPSPSPSRITG
jgi:hypothetical protein